MSLATGAELGTYSARVAPAFVGDLGFFLAGQVTAFDEVTGAEVWAADAGAPIKLPEEYNGFQTAALAAADGLLLVPASGRLVAFG